MTQNNEVVVVPKHGEELLPKVTVSGEVLAGVVAVSGITEADLPAVHSLVAKLDVANPMSISEFGRDVGEHTSNYTDDLLSQVNADDLDASGAKLNQVVLTAKSLNLKSLSDRRSRIPIIGKYIDRLSMTKERFVQQFNTTKEQIDSLMTEIGDTQRGLSARVTRLEDMFGSVVEEHRLLGMHIAAGKLKLQEMREDIDGRKNSITNDMDAQLINDLENTYAKLDKRVGDLEALQQSALQSLPMIRMIQSNNGMLVEKFHTIREITIPAWKRQFMLSLSLNEQKNAVQLAGTIDDATNEFLRRNAELLHKNSVDTARANQRLVIDVDTLEKVQSTLITTVQDVIRIQQEGARDRRQAEKRLLSMRNDLRNRLVDRSAA